MGRNPFFIRSLVPSRQGVIIVFGVQIVSQSLLHQVIGSFLHSGMRRLQSSATVAIPSSSGHWFLPYWRMMNSHRLPPESQSLLHQVIGSFTEDRDEFEFAEPMSQSLLHQVIGSFL